MVKKVFYFSLICGLSHYSTAQVGIGTENPQATLHIVPKDDKDPLKIEGLKEEGQSQSSLLSVDNQGVVNKVELSKLSGRLIHSENVMGTDEVVITGKNMVNDDKDVPGLSVNYTPSIDCTALVTVNAVPIQRINSTSLLPMVRSRIKLKLNDNIIFDRFILKSSAPDILPLNFTTIANLDANKEYTFKVIASQTVRDNDIIFNKKPDPNIKDIGNGQTSSMTILFYSR